MELKKLRMVVMGLWLAGASAGWTADKIYHFTAEIGKGVTTEAWVSGEKFRRVTTAQGNQYTHIYDGKNLYEMRRGAAGAKMLGNDKVGMLAMWKTMYQQKMGELTPGEDGKVGTTPCTSQKYTVKARGAQLDITEWVEKASGMVLKRDVETPRGTQSAELAGFEEVATVKDGWFDLPAGTAVRESPGIGRQASDFSLKTYDTNQAIKLSDYKGKKPVFLNFFATWCGPCRGETPEFVKVYEEYKDKDIAFISVDAGEQPGQDTVALLTKFVKEMGVQWPILVDEVGSPVSEMYEVKGIPTNIVIDKDGVIKFLQSGGISGDMLKKQLNKVLGIAAADKVANPFQGDPE